MAAVQDDHDTREVLVAESIPSPEMEHGYLSNNDTSQGCSSSGSDFLLSQNKGYLRSEYIDPESDGELAREQRSYEERYDGSLGRGKALVAPAKRKRILLDHSDTDDGTAPTTRLRRSNGSGDSLIKDSDGEGETDSILGWVDDYYSRVCTERAGDDGGQAVGQSIPGYSEAIEMILALEEEDPPSE